MFFAPFDNSKAYNTRYPSSLTTDAKVADTIQSQSLNKTGKNKLEPKRKQQLVSEIVIPASFESLLLILPSLAYLSRQHSNRWLTWITERPLPIELLKQFDFELDKIRVIYAKSQTHTKELLYSALNSDTSHTVLASPGRLNKMEMNTIESLAAVSSSKAVLVRLNEF